MSVAKGLMTAWTHIAPEHEAEFNQWYDGEHVPQIVALPGFVRGRRYVVEGAKPKYLAWYDTGDENAGSGPDLQRAIDNPTHSWRRFAALLQHRERMSFRLMRDVGDNQRDDAPWLYIVHTDIPDGIADEYNEWYDREHLPRLVTVPGVLRARRYNRAFGAGPQYLTAYELTAPAVWESPAAHHARKTQWTDKMRSLFQNTRRSMCKLILPVVGHSAESGERGS
jgi:hypothetical protein